VTKVLYLDCFSGVSGDMLLGACLDAGVPLDAVRTALGSLGLDDYAVSSERVVRAGISATRWVLDERVPAGAVPAQDGGAAHPHRHVAQIERLIARSALAPASRERAIALIRRLATIEADIHQMALEDVHLHEVGALDSIIDIVGAVFGFEQLGIDDVVAAPLNVGSGTIEIAHGTYPVPDANNPFADPQFPFGNPPYAARAYSYVTVAQFEALKIAWYYKYLYNRPAPSAVDPNVKALVPSNGLPAYHPDTGQRDTVCCRTDPSPFVRLSPEAAADIIGSSAHRSRSSTLWRSGSTRVPPTASTCLWMFIQRVLRPSRIR